MLAEQIISVCLQDYEEDFEEFDEDKEEEEEVRESEKREAEREMSPRSRREVEDIRRAMEKENELLGTARSTPSTQGSEISDRGSARLVPKPLPQLHYIHCSNDGFHCVCYLSVSECRLKEKSHVRPGHRLHRSEAERDKPGSGR